MVPLRSSREREAAALLDRTIGPRKAPIEASGNVALDAALNDPEAGEAIQAMVVSSAVAGGYYGFVGGTVTGALLLWIVHTLWPKKIMDARKDMVASPS